MTFENFSTVLMMMLLLILLCVFQNHIWQFSCWISQWWGWRISARTLTSLTYSFMRDVCVKMLSPLRSVLWGFDVMCVAI